MQRKIRVVEEIIGTRSAFATLSKQLEIQKSLLRRVSSYLPPPLDQHCLGAIPGKGTLTLLTDSPVWSSRLRFLTDALLRRLRNDGVAFGRIIVKVVSTQSPDAVAQHPPRRARLSHMSAELLRDTAEHTSDEKLKQALLRLSSHAD
ncbi:Protein of unknown function (DUF721) [endosymbiont of Ridgeia piscesae]|jgi:hypothetical protein|uniref:DUF721 domain-containing protein n=1 Tax=endosymbiont of Ridgeia piscesae TaxID=54398 RepID=A0A0T5Z7Q8_9GAMM|nr:DciA family protein [endosymbiont of Ridgeia piscesae]KRT54562.1 Protein of unknown function (DUF721) [endosymbiont of Ridgeia piscesae]KRT58864.1 Protein of unknown function (DUF721) [endosymbiont of Ridgeia piscesae]